MIVIFLGYGAKNIVLQEMFQHSRETINKHIHAVLVTCLKFSFKYIRP